MYQLDFSLQYFVLLLHKAFPFSLRFRDVPLALDEEQKEICTNVLFTSSLKL